MPRGFPKASIANRKSQIQNRAAFSFPEVLFAVIILGIGFIMIAAIFPVAISQSKMTLDETAASAVARAKVAEIQGVTYNANTPAAPQPWPITFMPTGVVNGGAVRPIENFQQTPQYLAWDQVRGLELLRNDPRYACVVLYRRSGTPVAIPAPPVPIPATDWSDTAQIYLIEVTCRGTQRPQMGAFPPRLSPQFDQVDYARGTTNPNAVGAVSSTFDNLNNLSAHQIQVQTRNNVQGSGIDGIFLNATAQANPGTTQNLPGAIAEGTYVVISNDPTPTGAGHTNLTGRIYRVGIRRTDWDGIVSGHAAFELQPGNDIQVLSTAPNQSIEDIGPADAPAFCVGRERLPDGSFVGASQDVSIYTTTIPVKP